MCNVLRVYAAETFECSVSPKPQSSGLVIENKLLRDGCEMWFIFQYYTTPCTVMPTTFITKQKEGLFLQYLLNSHVLHISVEERTW